MAGDNYYLDTTPDEPSKDDFETVPTQEQNGDLILVPDNALLTPPTPLRASPELPTSPSLFPDSDPVSPRQSPATPPSRPLPATSSASNSPQPRGVISGLTAADRKNAKYLTYCQLDMLLQILVEGNVFHLSGSPTGLYWLPDKEIPQYDRLVSAVELEKRLRFLVDYRAPFTRPQSVAEEIRTPTSHCTRPWPEIRRMAFAGYLEYYPANDREALRMGIRTRFFNGDQSNMEWFPEEEVAPRVAASDKKRKSAGGAQVAAPRKQRRSVVAKMGASPVVAPSKQPRPVVERKVALSVAPSVKADEEDDVPSVPARANKRKSVPAEEDAPPIAAPNKRRKATPEGTPRSTNVMGQEQNPKSEGDRFGANIKLALNHRARDNADYKAFSDAIIPESGPHLSLPAIPEDQQAWQIPRVKKDHRVGDTTGLHPSEIRLCDLLELTGPQYKCQKARAFLGLALFIEFNEQMRKENPPPKKMHSYMATSIQQSSNIDVNKASKLHLAFKLFGWVGDDIGADLEASIPASYLERFPRDHRLKLMREMAGFERMRQKAKLEMSPEAAAKDKFEVSLCSSFNLDD